MRFVRCIAVTWILAGLVPAPSFSQDREPPPPTGLSVIPFRFGPPGARSLGLGGAFIALADDATASEANPAGLTRLFRPEVSIHGTFASTDLEVIDLNAAAALSQLNSYRPGYELQGGDRIGNAFADSPRGDLSDSPSDVSFASFVKPFETYTFSVYFQRSADFESQRQFRAYDDFFLDLYETRQQIGIDLESFGVSAAFKAGDFVSIGFSLRHTSLRLRALQEIRVDYILDIERRYLDADFSTSLEEVQELPVIDFTIGRLSIDDSASDITFNVGVLLNPKPGAKWSLGLVYKDGGEFEISGVTQDISCLSTNGVEVDIYADGNRQSFFCNPTTLTGDGAFVATTPIAGSRLKIPDFLGLGFAWQIAPRLKLAFDVDAITYSDLDPNFPDDPDIPPVVLAQIEELDDEVELHLGLEYTSFLGESRIPLIFRGGVFTDPDHDGFKEIDSDETILTFGIGTVIKDKVQLDVAGQFSGPTDGGILSLVYRF